MIKNGKKHIPKHDLLCGEKEIFSIKREWLIAKQIIKVVAGVNTDTKIIHIR